MGNRLRTFLCDVAGWALIIAFVAVALAVSLVALEWLIKIIGGFIV